MSNRRRILFEILTAQHKAYIEREFTPSGSIAKAPRFVFLFAEERIGEMKMMTVGALVSRGPGRRQCQKQVAHFSPRRSQKMKDGGADECHKQYGDESCVKYGEKEVCHFANHV